MSAETPLIRTNKLMSDLWITMKNTVRWQITSSALQGFIGSLETAYGYAQDVNESLTNIRIVTENSAEDMANFAKQANEAAKALSTTTVDYTDAALIYYQQGLSEQEVLDRTETTIKMANAAGVSAQTASDQLTAVWNNFYDGSKSLEYYADVMVRLGADTASSTDEISEGIQQFASVADTVGLSYEYAASALATVTATTRESANTVGTAFRTLFARIQGLNLGETLDDGTTLNKYSQALEKVGINIFDINGEIKSMDSLLDEMGEKYNNRPALIHDPAKDLFPNQKYAIVGILCLIQGASQTSAYSEEANNIVWSIIFSLGLSRKDVEKYLGSTMNDSPQYIVRRINDSLLEIRDKQYLEGIYKKCSRLADISGDYEMKILVDDVFREVF